MSGIGAEESTAAVLEHDHHEIDEQLARFATSLRDGAPDVAPLAAAADDLRHHIWVEEEHHFPLAQAAGLMGPVMVMLREHGQLWDLLDRLEAQVDEDVEPDAIEVTWDALEGVLAAHNAKEEVILYTAGDRAFTPEQTAGILAAFRDGRRPEGWVCAWAGRS